MAGWYMRLRSELDGKPILLVLTPKSKNGKIGDLAQAWILRDRMNPYRALQTGKDASVCGDCPRRHHLGGDCYVSMKRGPHNIYMAVKEGRAHKLDLANPPKRLIGRGLRLGAYGDPAAVPDYVWEAVLTALRTPFWVGYTHQWARPEAQVFRGLLMASVDSPQDAVRARKMGWRTFRVRGTEDPIDRAVEMVCPASVERNKLTDCAHCRACDGQASPKRPNVTIVAHGFLNRKGAVALNVRPKRFKVSR